MTKIFNIFSNCEKVQNKMEADKKANDRYFTNQQEFQILKDNIQTYFSFAKRSQDRKRINTETTEKLNKVNPGRWNEKLVRVWFTNNKDRILNPSDPNNQTEAPVDNQPIASQNDVKGQILPPFSIHSDQIQTQRPMLPPFVENFSKQTSLSLQQMQSPLQQLPPPMQQIQPVPPQAQQSMPLPQAQALPPLQQGQSQVPNETPSELPQYACPIDSNRNDIYSTYGEYPSSSGEIPLFKSIYSYEKEANKDDSYPQIKSESNKDQSSQQTANEDADKTSKVQNNTTNQASNQNAQSDEEEETKNEEESDDELPEPPDFDQDITGGKMDQIKYEIYNKFLPNCYRYFKKLRGSNDQVRLEKQLKLEDVFVRTLKLFSDKCGIPVILSKDVTTLFIYSRNQIRRTFSVTTQRYNNEPVDTDSNINSDLIEGSPFIYYSKNFKPPPTLNNALRSFYLGKYENGNRTCTILCNVEAAAFMPTTGDPLSVVFNHESRYHQLVIGENNADSQTGFFLRANSMFVQNNTVWIQGDVRVRTFDLNSFQCIDTLYIRKDLINQSAITIWNGNVAVGVDSKIYLYSLNHQEVPNKEDAKFKKNFEDLPRRLGIELAYVDWTHGRNCRKQIDDEKLGKITSMITVGQNLVVASEDYPVIHVYGPDETLIASLTGHTMGITSLYPSEGNSFFSGSKDMTLKKWSLDEFIAETSFLRHCGPVTAITTANYLDHLFLFSGSSDSRVNVWDVTRKKSTFQINLTDGFYPIAMFFTPSSVTLSIIAVQKNKDSEVGMKKMYNNPNDDNQDQIQTFIFSSE